MTTPFPFVPGAVLQAQQLNDITNLPINDQTTNYTLVVGDAGKRVIMNVGSASTVTVNDSIFAEGDTIFIANKASDASVITAGAGVTINTSGSLSLAQYGGGTLIALSASTFTFFPAGGGVNYGVATGGSSASRTIGGDNYTVLTFATDDNLVVTTEGLFDVLLVGGGGGGAGASGGAATGAGGGGGAGALAGFASTTTIYLTAGTYAVDVGAGGAGGQFAGVEGGASYIGSIISACGAGAGGGCNSTSADTRATSCSGGSGGGTANTANGKSVDETFGNDGGTGVYNTAAGGGGGYASAGGNGASTTGGSGGNGTDVSSWGTSASTDNIAAGGGGGGSVTGGTAGTGGVAGKTSGAGNNATTAGSGGGGSRGADTAGGNGAAGKVFVRFKV
jgi:hypothetical protein